VAIKKPRGAENKSAMSAPKAETEIVETDAAIRADTSIGFGLLMNLDINT
jgi:hypothetical protein